MLAIDRNEFLGCAAFRNLSTTVDGTVRKPSPWPDWMLTTVLDTSDVWPVVWRAINCHKTQMSIYKKLESLSADDHDAATILLVEDNPEVAQVSAELLEQLHYRVRIAGGPEAALNLLGAGEEVDLVISDERMPGMTGTEFLLEARERSPRTGRGILTGYPSEALVRCGLEAGADTFLYKPWEDRSLRENIRRLLERQGSKGSHAVPEEESAEDSFDLGGEGG